MRQLFLAMLAGLMVPSASSDAVAVTGDATQENTSRWQYSASAFLYFVPHEEHYLQPTIAADRDHLHLELRYNYEDRETASAWVGYNFNLERDVSLVVTPMIGGVFGLTDGVAPGYLVSLSWRRLALYSEGELFLDVENDYTDFFYSWSELTLFPLDWLATGLAMQKTEAYRSTRDVQIGLLLGIVLERWGVNAYALNPDETEPIYVLSVYGEF